MTGFFGRVAMRESFTKIKTVNYCGLFEQVGKEKGGMGNENKEFEYNLKRKVETLYSQKPTKPKYIKM